MFSFFFALHLFYCAVPKPGIPVREPNEIFASP
jgi:hypothetical protein